MSDEELVDDDIDELVEAFHQGKIRGEAFLEKGGSDAYQDEHVACYI